MLKKFIVKTWAKLGYLTLIIGFVALSISQLSVTAIAADKVLPETSMGRIRVAISLYLSKQESSKDAKVINGILTRMEPIDALALVRKQSPEIPSRVTKSIQNAIDKKGVVAATVKVKNNQFLAFTYKDWMNFEVDGVLVDLGLQDGGISIETNKNTGLTLNPVGGLCFGCTLESESICVTCNVPTRKAIGLTRDDYRLIDELPVDKATKLSISIIPLEIMQKAMLKQCPPKNLVASVVK